MDSDLFKIAGAVAGIGGIAFASVVYIFREVIRKEIFPQLTKDQAYKLVNRIIVLTFMIGVLGVVAYLAINLRNVPQRPTPAPTPTPIPETRLFGTVFDQNERPLQGAKVTVDEVPGMQPVETSSDGVFILHSIPKKDGDGVRVRVVLEGYQPNPYTEDVVLGKAPPKITLRRKR